MERRTAEVEVRARGRRLEGHAALFNTRARIGAGEETIRPGAFAADLSARRDVLALVDHDDGRVLGRTRSGTLRLAEDTRGLAFELDVPDTTDGRDVLALAERGDLGGMSFGFSAGADDAPVVAGVRELRAVRLFEISVVKAWPAYPGTSVEARRAAGQGRSVALARRLLELL